MKRPGSELDPDDNPDEKLHASTVSAALRAIRLLRRMKASEVAEAMRLQTRTYERFEAGTGRVTYARISLFARATDSDPVAILAAIPLRSPEFAIACADNKLMTVAMTTMRELDQELGSDISLLPVSILVAAFDKLGKDLVAHVRRRDEFAERWIEEKASQIDGAGFLGRSRSARPKV